MVPSEDLSKSNAAKAKAPLCEAVQSEDSATESRVAGHESCNATAANHTESIGEGTKENQGVNTAERSERTAPFAAATCSEGSSSGALMAKNSFTPAAASYTQNGNASGQQQSNGASSRSDLDTIGKSPGEIAFFKLLHAEFKKATHFFERAQQEYIIREERVRKGMEIMKQPNSIMVGEKWSLLAKSIYRLYKDLLLLETFAIMTYCGFSKILKKHDKVTGYHTRNAFMANIVNKANFTNYPKVLEMISRCEQLYEEVSNRLVQDGKHGLYEDERLFINMIHRLNEQVMEGVEGEGAPGRMESRRLTKSMTAVSSPSKESWATSSLRQLVNENDASRLAGQVSETNECNQSMDSDDDDDRKQKAIPTEACDYLKRSAFDLSEVDQGERKRPKGWEEADQLSR